MTATLRATINGVSASANVSLKVTPAPATVQTIYITPSTVTLSGGQSATFTVSGTMSDGSTITDATLQTASWRCISQNFTLNSTIGKSITGTYSYDGTGYYIVAPTTGGDTDKKDKDNNKNDKLVQPQALTGTTSYYTATVRVTLGGKTASATVNMIIPTTGGAALLPQSPIQQTQLYAPELEAVQLGNGSKKNVQQTATNTLVGDNTLIGVSAPYKNEIITGVYNVYGWALDMNGVPKVEVIIDGSVIGQAVYGDARPDVYTAYPQYNNQNAGFHYSINTATLAAGNHTISIRATDTAGTQTTWVPRAISVAYYTTGTITTNYTYDDNGNLIKAYKTNGTTVEVNSYAFNEFDQMAASANTAGIRTTYTYYADDMRKSKTTGTKTTGYYYDGDNVIIESLNGSLSARNIRGTNLLARQDNIGTTMYYLYNGHGDVVSMTDSAGVIKNLYDYDIYGKAKTITENGMANPVRYAGEYFDDESGMYYLRARYYNPDIMRFIAEDTYNGDVKDPLSLNLYAYCQGNPIKYIDPSGHEVGMGGFKESGGGGCAPRGTFGNGSGIKGSFSFRGAWASIKVSFKSYNSIPGRYKFIMNSNARGMSSPKGAANSKYVNLASASRTKHILFGDKTGGGHIWPGAPGKTAFPKGWSVDKIMHEVSDIVTDSSIKWIENRLVTGVQRYEVIGIRDGVKIKIITDGKDIITAYPIK